MSLAETLTAHLDAVSRRRRQLGAPQVLVVSGDRSEARSGSTGSGGALTASADTVGTRAGGDQAGVEFSYGERSRPFHIASIGKMMTAVIVMQLVSEGAFELDTPAQSLLPVGTLDGLFTVKGTDHAATVTVLQLLDHTSGAADYFGGRVAHGPRFIDLVTTDTDRLWQPLELLGHSRDNQRAVGRPGTRFAYSDTGYVVLGLIVEQVTGRAFHEVLHERILGPLGMNDSYMPFRSTPVNPTTAIAPFWLGRVEASAFRSISCDWAGGGIVSTLDDLVRFSRALHGDSEGEGRLVNAAQLAEMQRARNRFRPGIHYGTGLMQLRFEGFSPLLRGLPRPTGHIGVLGTHLFYDDVNDAHIAMNFGSTREMVRSFTTLIQIERLLGR